MLGAQVRFYGSYKTNCLWIHFNSIANEGRDVPFGEGGIGGDGDLSLGGCDGNGVAESSGFASDLDSFLEELLERGDLHDFVIDWFGAVDYERHSFLLGTRLHRRSSSHLLSLYANSNSLA